MHSIDSLIELAGLIVSGGGSACLIYLFATWLNGQYLNYQAKRYILLLRVKYELSKGI